MGGRSFSRAVQERESWISQVSDSRLKRYERLMSSPVASPRRLDGSLRVANGVYFSDLILREKIKRGV